MEREKNHLYSPRHVKTATEESAGATADEEAISINIQRAKD
jgi:hypothetical protein